MFKKLHSNRDPQDTVFTELKKEFSLYIWKANRVFAHATELYPQTCYWLMVILLLFSLIFSFVLMNHPKEPVKTNPTHISVGAPTGAGFDQIIATAAALKETMALKNQADSLLAKKVLSHSDSATLEKDLDRLQQLHNHLNK